MFLCIVAFVGERLATHMEWPNTEGSNLKLYLSRFLIYNVWFYTWQQTICCHYKKLVKDHHVCIGNSHVEHYILF